MNVTISPADLTGRLAAIPSKSDAHRKLICAALSDGGTRLTIEGGSNDISATTRCLEALGGGFDQEGGGLNVTPVVMHCENPLLDCGESGSTFRFLLPVAAALYRKARFTGSGRLPDRPIGQLMEAMEVHGVGFSSRRLPLETTGRLTTGDYTLPGNVSSQFITGLMLALPRLEGDSEIALTSSLESRAYVDMTVNALRLFGVEIIPSANGWKIPGGQSFTSPGAVTVDGDWSNAAFFLCGGAIGSPVTVTGLDLNSAQGDKTVISVLRRLGANIIIGRNEITVMRGSLTGCEIDVREVPDLLPVLAAVAACANGDTRFTGAARLRLKESDRLTATAEMLTGLGGSAEELPDGLIVHGGQLTGGTVSGFGDHRMVMAAAVAAIGCRDSVTITGAEAVKKSYPGFFEHYTSLGGAVNVL